MWYLLDQAPGIVDEAFFRWLETVERSLAISFGDWHPSYAESLQLEQVMRESGEDVPDELQVYYSHAYPFDRIKNGAFLWAKRLQQYRAAWAERLLRRGMTEDQVQASLSSMPALWPLDCLRQCDTVAFQIPAGDLAIVRIDSTSAVATPMAIGLRNYFLAQIGLHILAEEWDTRPDWEKQRTDPAIASLSKWPDSNAPRHICLES